MLDECRSGNQRAASLTPALQVSSSAARTAGSRSPLRALFDLVAPIGR
jgi:hypothetical protein